MSKTTNIESCEILANKYVITISRDFNGLSNYEFVEQSEKYYKKAEKILELYASAIIRTILSDLNIGYKENNNESYKNALNSLKSMKKSIFIKDFPSAYNGKVVKETENHTFKIDSDNYIGCCVYVGLEDL